MDSVEDNNDQSGKQSKGSGSEGEGGEGGSGSGGSGGTGGSGSGGEGGSGGSSGANMNEDGRQEASFEDLNNLRLVMIEKKNVGSFKVLLIVALIENRRAKTPGSYGSSTVSIGTNNE